MAGVDQLNNLKEDKYLTETKFTAIHEKTSTKLLSRRNSSENLIKSTLSTESFNKISRNVSVEIENTLDLEEYVETLNNHKNSITFEPLEEEGEEYLRECFILPPIGDHSPAKYYINPHPTESEMSSSVNSANEWWDQVNYADLEVPRFRPARGHSQQKETEREDVVEPRRFSLTYKTRREYKEREKKREEEYRAQIISVLEKQMVSLYNLKQQYKKTIHVEGCQRDQLTLPLAVASDQLTRHRDSLVNRIKRKKIEDELKRKRQVERKLDIIKKLLSEQRSKGPHQENTLETIEQRKVPGLEKVKFTSGTNLEIKSQDEELREGGKETDAVEVTEETKPAEDVLQDKADPDVGVILNELQVLESVALNSPRKISSTKKDKKKKSPKNLDNESEKPNKKKKKKISAESEAPTATCEEKSELPASQMKDLALWFENWREIQDEQYRFQKELEDKKLPVENNVVIKPSKVSFKDVWPGRLARQLVAVTNVGEEALQCRLAPLIQLTPLLKADLEGPSKARTGNCWTLTLTLEASDTVEDMTEEVRLEFCRRDGSRSQLTVGVEVLRPRAQPALSTACIRFGPQVFWSPAAASGQVLVSNSGSLGCVVRWVAVPSTSPLHLHTDSDVKSQSEESCDVAQVARAIVEDVFQNVFSVFRIDSRQGLTVPPRSHVTIPVLFIPSMTSDKGDVFTKYMFTFEGECVENATQELVVCGKIEKSPFTLTPEVLYMGVCYTSNAVQQSEVQVTSAARHVCSVCTRVPRILAGHVTVQPRETLLQAHSSVTFLVRLTLG